MSAEVNGVADSDAKKPPRSPCKDESPQSDTTVNGNDEQPSTSNMQSAKKSVTFVVDEDEQPSNYIFGRMTRSRKTVPAEPIGILRKRKRSPRGKGRRSLTKAVPRKLSSIPAVIKTADHVVHRGRYLRIGDVVSVLGIEGDTYYAQIRGFVIDQYDEKSAVIMWLLPTKASPPPAICFDPITYISGPEEDLPRKLDYMEYVMHLSMEFYKGNSPYPLSELESIANVSSGFVWTSVDRVYRDQPNVPRTNTDSDEIDRNSVNDEEGYDSVLIESAKVSS